MFLKHRGIYFDKSKGKWAARLMLDGEMVLFKRFKTEDEAIQAYNETKKELMDEYEQKLG